MDSFILPVEGKSAENNFQGRRERGDGYRKAVARLAKEFDAITMANQAPLNRAADAQFSGILALGWHPPAPPRP
jgi:hypothetical protein